MSRVARERALPFGFVEFNYGLTAHGKLWRQLGILNRRIRVGCSSVSPGMELSVIINTPIYHIVLAELELDTETFYTVAADFLKLACLIIGDPRKLKSELIYRRIQWTRNWLIRHAFECPEGVANSVWGYGSVTGPQLKAGSGSRLIEGSSGYFEDHAQLLALTDRFRIDGDGIIHHWEQFRAARASTKVATGVDEL